MVNGKIKYFQLSPHLSPSLVNQYIVTECEQFTVIYQSNQSDYLICIVQVFLLFLKQFSINRTWTQGCGFTVVFGTRTHQLLWAL